ncbi:extracellular electron transfer flavoprotein PplA [Caldifermentibacillus hisashii]|uniref:extracellular electron transfer flavoprotein PplA n=1 Tax=Caldifermentibacillus hisashii TaxID=996558 RepID=UPI0034D48D39
MKYHKIFVSSLLSLSLLLCACGNNDDNAKKNNNQEEQKDQGSGVDSKNVENKVVAGSPLQDGTYSLTETNYDENGWRATERITVKNGKITKADYNYINEEGKLKTDDKDYQKNMSAKTGVGPQDYIPQLNKQLVKKQDAKQVEIVSGATHSSEKFVNYSQQLIQKAQAGDTTEIQIDTSAPLKDGVYKLTERNLDTNGWKTYINMTVEGGRITQVDYNNVNADGKLKSEDEDYEKNMKDKSGVGPKEYIPQLSQALVESQNTEGISVVSGATHSSHLFKMYAAQLINAAQRGDTTPIEVDNIVFAEE